MKNQTISPEVRKLYSKGYTLRAAARELNVSPGHLSLVIAGRRESASLSKRLRALAERPVMRGSLAAK